MIDVEPNGTAAVARRKVPGWALMGADALALLAFVGTGAASHHDASFAVVLARNLVPWAVTWVGAASIAGTYRRPGWASLIKTWALAAPVALLIRSWVVGEPRGLELLQFLLVGGAFSLLYLILGRVLLRVGTRGSARVPS